MAQRKSGKAAEAKRLIKVERKIEATSKTKTPQEIGLEKEISQLTGRKYKGKR